MLYMFYALQDIVELFRLWQISPRLANRSMIGTWLLSCSNIEFSNDVIINASFDHFKFHEKCVAQLIYIINTSVIKIQTVVRIFLARLYVSRLATLRRQKKKHKQNAKKMRTYSSPMQRHVSVNTSALSDDESSIVTEYSQTEPGKSLENASVHTVHTEQSYNSLSSEGSRTNRSRVVELKPSASTLRDRSLRERSVLAVYTNPLSRTAPSGRPKKKPSKKQTEIALQISKNAMQSELQTLRDEIGSVLLGFDEELRGVKQNLCASPQYRPSDVGAAGPNNVLNEVSHICESELQPVKEMMAMVLKEISSLKGSGSITPRTPALQTAEQHAEAPEKFSAEMSALMAQMAELQQQMAEQQQFNLKSRESMKEHEPDANLVHESVLKAYKEKVAMLEKSEADKIKRIAVLNLQIRRSSTAVTTKQRETYNEMMTTKVALEHANEELGALKISLKQAEDELIGMKHAIANSSNTGSKHAALLTEYEVAKSQLQDERARVEKLENDMNMLAADHELALQLMATKLDESREEVRQLKVSYTQRCSEAESLKSKLQEVTARLEASDTKMSHLESMLQQTKSGSDKSELDKVQRGDFLEIQHSMQQTIDQLNEKVTLFEMLL